jgi:PAS domain S-box-containing protein
MSESDKQDFEQLIDFVKRNRGFDLTIYKRPSLMRRVRRRMQDVGVATFAEYRDLLEVDPSEFARLFNTILINVTGFFRDAEAWEYLAEAILPRIIAGREEGQAIRIWSAGCASREEPYSLAMLLADTLGVEECRDCVKIYATDGDTEALDQARADRFAAAGAFAPPEAEEEPSVEVLDRDLNVLLWNPSAADMWGLHTSEVVGRSSLKLDIGLPVEKLRGRLQAFLAGQGNGEQVSEEGVSRRGKRVRCDIRITSLQAETSGERQGVVMLIEATPIEAEP